MAQWRAKLFFCLWLSRKGNELREKFVMALLSRIFLRWQLMASNVVDAVARRKEQKKQHLVKSVKK